MRLSATPATTKGGAEVGSSLAKRLLASAEFAKSPRLTELLRYLWDCASKDPSTTITEHQIGVAIYGWNPDNDSGTDSIVRVQVSQLRKKLEHYFSNEGRNEPDVMVIPRGLYTPVIQPREGSGSEQVPVAPTPSASTGRRISWRILVAACLLSAVAAWFLTWVVQKPAPRPGPTAATPTLDNFWKMFQNGRTAQIVLSDSSLLILEDIVGHRVPLNLYRSPEYPAQLLAGVTDPEMLRAARNVVGMEMTGTQDAAVSKKLELMGARYRFATNLISARNFAMPQPGNLILLGHTKVNPWIELFEGSMNFRYEFDYQAHTASIVSRAPLAGEPGVYPAVFGKHGYCVVACLPNPMDEGVALLIFGSDVSSLQAGGQLVSDESSMQDLYARMGGAAANSDHYFEALLETQLLGSQAPAFHIVSVRSKHR